MSISGQRNQGDTRMCVTKTFDRLELQAIYIDTNDHSTKRPLMRKISEDTAALYRPREKGVNYVFFYKESEAVNVRANQPVIEIDIDLAE